MNPLRPRPPGARDQSFSDRLRARSNGEKPSVSHGYIRSFDDTRIFYSVEGKGRPLIFCYGLVCSSLHWTYQIDHFRRSHQAIWTDYRGHQNSEVPKDLKSLTLENVARDVLSVLDELKIEDAVFLGHSMGVNVVLEIYRQQPKRVAGMVLANGTPKRPLETLFNNNMLESVFSLLRKTYEKSPKLVDLAWTLQKNNPLARTLLTLGGFNPHLTPQDDIRRYADQVAEMDPAILLHLIGSYDHYDATAWLHTIDKPTLVIAGENDKITPIAQQELLHQLIPGSKLEIIRHGSHCPQMDLPELVSLKIENFLKEIDYSSKS